MNSNLKEYICYLKAWCHTRNEEYTPYDTRDIEKILVNIVKSGETKPIQTFKARFENGEINLPIFCISLLPEYEKECYDEMIKVVNAFEEKYQLN